MAAHVAGADASPTCSIMVDCSASDALPDHYAEWLALGCHVVTPNKKLGAGPLTRFQATRRQQRQSGRHFMYEVGLVAQSSGA